MTSDFATRAETASRDHSISAELVVNAPVRDVFGFLANFGNHCSISVGFIEVLELDCPDPR